MRGSRAVPIMIRTAESHVNLSGNRPLEPWHSLADAMERANAAKAGRASGSAAADDGTRGASRGRSKSKGKSKDKRKGKGSKSKGRSSSRKHKRDKSEGKEGRRRKGKGKRKGAGDSDSDTEVVRAPLHDDPMVRTPYSYGTIAVVMRRALHSRVHA